MIHASKDLKNMLPGFFLLAATWMSVIPCVMAQDLVGPEGVVNEYLTSLVTGDTHKLIMLIDGKMKNNNKQLILNPETYSQFLKAHHEGVQTIVETLVPDGEIVHAYVHLEYSAEDSSLIELLLMQRDGEWKIIDELY